MKNKKKLLFFAHYYYPDVASTGQILKELAEGLANTYEVTVICVVPSYTGKIEARYKKEKFYKETINGVNVIRIRVPEFTKTNKKSRIQNIVIYFGRAIQMTLQLPKQDYIYTISQPPILGGMLGVIGKTLKEGKLIYNIQDFNPEQTMAIKYTGNPLLLKTAMAMDKFTCQRADQVILVGRDMVETLKQRFKQGNLPNHVFINNWIDEKEIYPLSRDHVKVQAFKKKYSLENKFIIAYSGNIGLYYDLENIMQVIGKFKEEKEVVFAFIGAGTVKEQLTQIKIEQKMDNVVFIPYQDKEDLIYSLNAADAHWVVNAKGIKGISVPSKLYGVMAVGKPVLGVLEKDSEARLLIEEAKCGHVTEPADYQGMEQMLTDVIHNKTAFSELGMNGRRYLEKHLTKEVSIQKYQQIIEGLSQPKKIQEKGALEI